jgi:hypothetical protein
MLATDPRFRQFGPLSAPQPWFQPAAGRIPSTYKVPFSLREVSKFRPKDRLWTFIKPTLSQVPAQMFRSHMRNGVYLPDGNDD